MGIVFDVIIVVIILASIYSGYKRGIVDVGIKLFATVISLLVSLFLCGPITTLVINNTEIDEGIEKIVTENLSSETNNNINEGDEISTYIKNYAQNIARDGQKSLAQSVASSIALSSVKIGVIIAIFIMVRIVFIILQIFTDVLTKIPVIKQCNEIGGIVYAILKALIIIYIALAILFYIGSISGNSEINSIIETTYITKFFYNVIF